MSEPGWMERYLNKVTCGDCLELMKDLPDKCVDAVITDPPYGLGSRLSQGAGKHKNSNFRKLYEGRTWDSLIDDNHIKNMMRVSVKMIMFGANYYTMPPTRGIICWDKKQHMPTFSRWEYAWTNIDCPAKMYEIRDAEVHIHATQKPTELMIQIINDYTSPSDIILDPFLGSGTTAVAAIRTGRQFIGFEIDQHYCDIANRRIQDELAQIKIPFEPIPEPKQEAMDI